MSVIRGPPGTINEILVEKKINLPLISSIFAVHESKNGENYCLLHFSIN